jgi:serine/threonine protein kinase
MSTSDIVELNSGEFSKRYKVIAKLGEGGMAIVHLALARGVAGVRKLIVLKSVRPEFVSDRKICEMFLAEARLAATLNHPNIVQTFEVVVSKNRPMLVMEYMDGQPLARILPLEGFPLSLALFAFKEILEGLEYAHNFTDIDGTSLNLVHRDISPHNVFVTYDGQVKLLDFGIAKIIGSSGHTQTGEIKGKVRYMAPEQMLASSKIDRRADLFSVGVMLWEAITRRRLWEGMSDGQVVQAVLRGGVPAPSTVNPQVDLSLDAICQRALTYECDERYASAAEMQADLEAAIEKLGLRRANRHIGQFVIESFADLRSSVRLAIEAQLRDDKSSPVTFVAEGTGSIITQSVSDGVAVGTEPQLLLDYTLEPSEPGAKPRPRHGFVAGAVAAIALVTLGLWFGLARPIGGGAHPATAAPLAAAAPSSPSAPSARPAMPPAVKDVAQGPVRVSITATPAGAKLYLDGEPLADNPYLGDRPRDSEPHELRVEAPGYTAQTIAVTFGESFEKTIELEATPASPTTRAPERHAAFVSTTPSAASTASAASATATSAASSESTRSCNPPFFFDSSGIKRFKLECLQ